MIIWPQCYKAQYFRNTENGLFEFRKIKYENAENKYGNTDKISVLLKYETLLH